MKDTYDRQASYVKLDAVVRRGAETYRGLMRCATVNNAPRTTQMPPTTTYAMPRNGFFPPMTVRVEIKIDFVPPYSVTGNATHCQIWSLFVWRVPTVPDIDLIHAAIHRLVVIA